jgi:hypothetical protein
MKSGEFLLKSCTNGKQTEYGAARIGGYEGADIKTRKLEGGEARGRTVMVSSDTSVLV